MVLQFGTTSSLAIGWGYKLSGTYVAAMVVTALSCRFGAHLSRKSRPALSLLYFLGTMAATLLAAAGLLVVAWPQSRWEQQAPMLMLIPLAYVIAARLYRGRTPEKPLLWIGHVATLLMLLFSLGTAVEGFGFHKGEQVNLLLFLFFVEAAVFYGLAAGLHRQGVCFYFCTLAGCAAVWQVLSYWKVPDEYYVAAFAVVGLLLLAGYRLSMLDRYGNRTVEALFACGNALLSLAFVAGVLMSIGELAAEAATRGTLVPLHLILLAISAVAVGLVRQQGWRRWYVVTTVANAALVVIVLAVLTDLRPEQKLELVCVAIGAGMLVMAHVGWYREQEREDDLVSVGMVFGSLLVAVPLTVVVLFRRCAVLGGDTSDPGTFYTLNEAGMFLAALLLVSTGFLFRLRASTVTGTIMAAVYLLTLLLYVRLPDQLQTTAVYLMIGGGVFFGLGLVLSIYREKLLTLPDRIRRREGVFRVLSWR